VPLTGDYVPSPRKWVRDQVERYEATDGREANTLAGTNRPVVIFTTRGRKSGKIRKFALMRVEHDGKYAMVASVGGAPAPPVWYLNLKADPDALMVQDGAERFDASARELSGEEREIWWQRAVQAYPSYAKYQEKTDREIPVLLAERRG
jgi:deazaflavin-dependent oxidoreductase (nitroreductase family)